MIDILAFYLGGHLSLVVCDGFVLIFYVCPVVVVRKGIRFACLSDGVHGINVECDREYGGYCGKGGGCVERAVADD